MQCNNNDFLARTICYLDDAEGVEVKMFEKRQRINKSEQERQKASIEARREEKKRLLITVPTFDEWIAQSYLNLTDGEQS